MRELMDDMAAMFSERYGRWAQVIESSSGFRLVIGGRWLVTASETAEGMKLVWPYGDGTVRSDVVTERDEWGMQIDMTVEAGWYM